MFCAAGSCMIRKRLFRLGDEPAQSGRFQDQTGRSFCLESCTLTSDGYRILPGITVPIDARRVEINRDGTMFAFFEGEIEGQQLGELQLATFINDKGLEAIGDNLFLETAASGAPNVGEPGVDGRGTFRQGYIEESSVDVVAEITELIEAQRGYELNSRVLSAARRDAVHHLEDPLMPRLSLVVSICLVLLPSVAFTEVWVTRTLRIGQRRQGRRSQVRRRDRRKCSPFDDWPGSPSDTLRRSAGVKR